jgi:hypothetical protein
MWQGNKGVEKLFCFLSFLLDLDMEEDLLNAISFWPLAFGDMTSANK